MEQCKSIEVRESALHGKGIFATDNIKAGTFIIEYTGERITAQEADYIESDDPDDPWHTFNFALDNGMVIDPRFTGNDAKYMNHSCDPNCETRQEGDQVFIYAIKDITKGDELFFDYSLHCDEEYTTEFKARYTCRCGSSNCRGTMLNLDYTPDVFGHRMFQAQTEETLGELQDTIAELQQNNIFLISAIQTMQELILAIGHRVGVTPKDLLSEDAEMRNVANILQERIQTNLEELIEEGELDDDPEYDEEEIEDSYTWVSPPTDTPTTH